MKKMLKQIKRLNGELEIFMFQLYNGLKLVSLVKEKKKFYRLYNPMVIMHGITEDGKEFYKLFPYQPALVVDSPNTLLRKKDTQVFEPTDAFKMHYMQRISGAKPSNKEGKKSVKSPSKEEANKVTFHNFRKYQNKANLANLTIVVNNTNNTSNTTDPDGPEAA
jgi:hypothetical protein